MKFTDLDFNFSQDGDQATPLSVTTLLAEYADGRRHFNNVDLRECNLVDAQLSLISLEEAILQKANLTGANLAGSTLNHIDLTSANLTNVNLIAADLVRAKLAGAKLAGAVMSGANLSGANLRKTDLTNCTFAGANLSGVDFAGAVLSNVNFGGAHLKGANLSEVDLSEVDLTNVDLSETILPESLAAQRWTNQNRDSHSTFSESVPAWTTTTEKSLSEPNFVQDEVINQEASSELISPYQDYQAYHGAEYQTDEYSVNASEVEGYVASDEAEGYVASDYSTPDEHLISGYQVEEYVEAIYQEYEEPDVVATLDDFNEDQYLAHAEHSFTESMASIDDDDLYIDALEAIDAIVMAEAESLEVQDFYPEVISSRDETENAIFEDSESLTELLSPFIADDSELPSHEILPSRDILEADSFLETPLSFPVLDDAEISAEISQEFPISDDDTFADLSFTDVSTSADINPFEIVDSDQDLTIQDSDQVDHRYLSSSEQLFPDLANPDSRDVNVSIEDPKDRSSQPSGDDPFVSFAPLTHTSEVPPSADLAEWLEADLRPNQVSEENLEKQLLASSETNLTPPWPVEVDLNLTFTQDVAVESTQFLTPSDQGPDAPLENSHFAWSESSQNVGELSENLDQGIPETSEAVSLKDSSVKPQKTLASSLKPSPNPDPLVVPAAKATHPLNSRVVQSIQSALGRRVQYSLQRKLLEIYQHQCAITGCNVQPLLETIFIASHDRDDTDHPSQCLVLRTDLRILYELKLLAIHPQKLTVLLSPHLLESDYGYLQGRKITVPEQKIYHPNPESLAQNLKDCTWYNSDHQENLQPVSSEISPHKTYGQRRVSLPIMLALGLGGVAVAGLIGVLRHSHSPTVEPLVSAPAPQSTQLSPEPQNRIHIQAGDLRYNQQGLLIDQKAHLAMEQAQQLELLSLEVPDEYQQDYQGQAYVSLAYLAELGTPVSWDANSRTAILDCCQSVDLEEINLAINHRDWPSAGIIVHNNAYVPKQRLTDLNLDLDTLNSVESIEYQGNTYLKASDLKDLSVVVQWNPETRVLSLSD